MKKMIAMLLALCMVIGLCACGGEKVDEALLGVYTCYEAETEGMTLPADMIFEEPCTLTLEQGGKGSFYIDGDEFTATYKIAGNGIELTADGDTITGTIKDGLMEIDMEGVMLYMAKEGVEPPVTAEAPAEAPADEPAIEEEPTTDDPAAEAPSGAAFEPVSVEFKHGTLTVVGIELFTDTEDKPAFAIYYDFTNNTDSLVTPWFEVEYEVTQEGYELSSTYTPWDAELPCEGNDSLDIAPGYTNRCVDMFNYNEQGGLIDVTIIDYNSDATLTLQIDPANVPGRPADFVYTPVSEPTISAGMTDTADVNYSAGTIRFDHYEWTEGYDGEKIIRVYGEYTNTSEEADNCWANLNCYAFQDGVALDYGVPMENAPEEDNLSTEIQPGESIMVAEVFEVRSDSPIEVVFLDIWEETGAATMISVE